MSRETSGPYLFLLLWKSSRSVESWSQRSIRELGFNSLSDFAVLEALLHKGEQAVKRLGERVLLTSGSITTAVDRLEGRGLVARSRCPEDGRVVLVSLTPAGRELIEQVFERHERDLARVFQVLDEEERLNFGRYLKKVGRFAEALNL